MVDRWWGISNRDSPYRPCSFSSFFFLSQNTIVVVRRAVVHGFALNALSDTYTVYTENIVEQAASL